VRSLRLTTDYKKSGGVFMPLQQLSEAAIYYELTDFTRPWASKQPTLLFVHGLNSSHRHWFNQVPVFARLHNVLTVDLRGHGESSAPAEGYSVHHHAGDLIELLDVLGIKDVIVVGASLGGCIAQQIAVRIADRVKSIVAVGSCAETPKELDLGALQPLLEQLGVKGFLREFLPQATFSPGTDAGLIEFAIEIALAAEPETIMRRTSEGLIYNGVDDARKINCQTLIILGENDQTTPRYCSEQLREIIHNSSLAIVPACGHLPHLETPEVFNEIVLRFLRKLCKERAEG
jgi:pimeloyl-ACP methyl ester carboxylesterase